MPDLHELFSSLSIRLREALKEVEKERTAAEAENRRRLEDPHLRDVVERLRKKGVVAGLDRENGGVLIATSEVASHDEMIQLCVAIPEITCVSMINTDISDISIPRIAEMPNLRRLRISDCRVTGEGLRLLEPMHRLQELDCSGLHSADDGMKYINRLTSLRHLDVGGCELTDHGVSQLTALHALERLDLNCTLVESGFAGLKNSQRLHTLSLERTRVSDDGCAAIAQCPSLRNVFVSHSPITDRGMAHLSSLPALSWLTVNGTQVTDAGVDLLIHCASLHHLAIDQPLLTARGVAALQQLPNLAKLSVYGDQYDPEAAQRLEAALPKLEVRWHAPGAAEARNHNTASD